MTSRPASVIAIFALLLLGALFSAAFGFISPDSWNYLALAQSVRTGDGCSVDGAYFANFPCGYPIAIALTAPSAEMSSLMIASKFTNLALLLGVFLLVAREFRNVLVPTFLVMNPVTIAIFQHTWSENLFLFAFCGAVYALSRINRGCSTPWNVILLGLFLIIGCASRYFFGPFAVIMFIGVWLAYGTQVAIKAFPAFVAAGLFFAAYQGFNISVAGYSTGMPRIPAPESLAFLLLSYVRALGRDAIYLVIAASILLVLSTRYWARSLPGMSTDEDRRNHVFLAFSGAGFLLLAFALRTRTQFDLFSYRTTGYGLVFLAAAAIGLLTRSTKPSFPILAATICCAFSLLAGQGRLVPRYIKDISAHGYTSPAAALRDYRSPPTDADLIVALATPEVAASVAGRPSLYYPRNAKIVRIKTAPNAVPQTRDELVAQLRSETSKTCVIDFTPFDSLDELQAQVEERFPTDVMFRSGALAGEFSGAPRYSPSMKEYLLAAFRPRSYVPCPL